MRCTEYCLRCKGPRLDQCTDCMIGYTRSGGTCVRYNCNEGCLVCASDGSCEENECDYSRGYVYDLNTQGCLYCPELASLRCGSKSGNKCVGCEMGYALSLDEEIPRYIDTHQFCKVHTSDYSGLDMGVCNVCRPDAYMIYKYEKDWRLDIIYKVSVYCRECPSYCTECASPTDCIHCPNPHSYMQDGVCYDCHPLCDQCYGPDVNQCVSCMDGMRPVNGSCDPLRVQAEKTTPPMKIRFHTVVIWYIAFLACISVTLRVTIAVYETITNSIYQKRIEEQRLLWQERKLDMEKSKLDGSTKPINIKMEVKRAGNSSGRVSSQLFDQGRSFSLLDKKAKRDNPLL